MTTSTNGSTISRVLVSTVLAVLCAVAAGRGQARGGGPGAAADLRNAIDIHVHGSPDSRPRALDGIEIARQAKAAGMRAIVLKNHYEYTSSLAYIVRKEVPGIEVFGGISLVSLIGGAALRRDRRVGRQSRQRPALRSIWRRTGWPHGFRCSRKNRTISAGASWGKACVPSWIIATTGGPFSDE